MTRPSRHTLLATATAILIAAIALVIAWRARGSSTSKVERATAPSAIRPPQLAGRGALVTLAGTIRDAADHEPVGDVEVVFRGRGADTVAHAGTNGTYRIELRPGAYRVAVRSDRVMTVAPREVPRLPVPPSAELVDVPDEDAMPLLRVETDHDALDLDVVPSSTITGRAFDPHGNLVPGAVIRANGELRPVLGSDTAITDAEGRYTLRVPAGTYALDVAHPTWGFLDDRAPILVLDTQQTEHDLVLRAGCVIAGRVLHEDGTPAPDGAMEMQLGFTDREMRPVGRIDTDGSFSIVVEDSREVTLRAWPWKSAPAPAQQFTCHQGARFDTVVFRVPEATPDLEGRIVDARGAPVPYAYLDISPLDLGGVGQQERADLAGRWEVYRMPPGRYLIRTGAPGHGVVEDIVTAPRHGIDLTLGGVGPLIGTTTALANGSFELAGIACASPAQMRIVRSLEHRLVPVRGGRFAIDDLPACTIDAVAIWGDQRRAIRTTVVAGGASTAIEIELGRPREKRVRGTIVDAQGRAVAGAVITASSAVGKDRIARSDGDGRFTLTATAGATLTIASKSGIARRVVGLANVDEEIVDLVLVDRQ